MKQIWILIAVLISAASYAGEYEDLREETIQNAKNRTIEGWSYVLGGGVALGVSLPGFYLSDDLFARSIYTFGQAVGGLSIAHGTRILLSQGEDRDFLDVVDSVGTLTSEQKNELVSSYLQKKKERQIRNRWVNAVTHGLLAVLFFGNSFSVDIDELRYALYFLSGANLLVGTHFAVRNLVGDDSSSGPNAISAFGGSKVQLAFRFEL